MYLKVWLIQLWHVVAEHAGCAPVRSSSRDVWAGTRKPDAVGCGRDRRFSATWPQRYRNVDLPAMVWGVGGHRARRAAADRNLPEMGGPTLPIDRPYTVCGRHGAHREVFIYRTKSEDIKVRAGINQNW
jgi:hypothetical protein